MLEIGRQKVALDVQRTRLFYRGAPTVSETCSCSGCRNFERAVETLPDAVRGFFETLGVEMKKVCEAYVIGARPDGALYYGGFYHLCGTLQPDDVLGAVADAGRSPLVLAKGFHVFLKETCDLLEEDFPTPAGQLEFVGELPWVLSEQNGYLTQLL